MTDILQKFREGSSNDPKKMFKDACCGIRATIISILISFAFPLASLIIGSIYIHDCPREKYIPIFLIVSGVFGIIRGIGSSIYTVYSRQQEDCDEDSEKCNPSDVIVGCFLFAWTIAGSVWVYRIYNDYQSEDPDADDFCNKTLYLYSFWSLTVGYIMVCLMICCGCAGIVMCAALADAN